jgi:hypothetical protein
MKHIVLLISIGFLLSCSDTISNKNHNALIQKLDNSNGVVLACIQNPTLVGEFMGESIFEGGFSGLTYIPGTDLEFYTITDRGPNTSLKDFLGKDHLMLFPFPDYAQKIIRLKYTGDKIEILSVNSVLDSNGNPVTGLPAERTDSIGLEIAVSNLDGNMISSNNMRFDFEGISVDANGDIWLVDEYRPAVVQVDSKTFKIKQIFSADELDTGRFKMIDKIFSKRYPNRGFEGVAVTPSGNIYAMLQSPLNTPELFDSIPNRLVRILYLNPKSGKSKIFGYELSINVNDPKIGDIVSINEHELLIVEHGTDSLGKVANVFHLNFEFATDISDARYNMQDNFEKLRNNARAQYRGIILAQKSHIINLIDAGYNPDFGKPEGLTILTPTTIAIVNDNDFGISSINENGELIISNQPSCIHFIKIKTPLYR